MNQLKRKVGPLELWQWLAIGAATGVVVYLYRKSHGSETPAGLSPEAEEKLLAGLSSQGGGGGEVGGGSGVAAPAPAGPEGAPGPVGPQGPNGEAFNPAPLETRLGTIEQDLANNNPPSLEHNSAPAAKGNSLVKNPLTGEMYRTVKKGNQTFHEYPGRTGPNKFVRVGGKAASRAPIGHQHKPRKRPKPVPIHKRVTVHHTATHAAHPKPVHHPAPKPPAKPKRKRGR